MRIARLVIWGKASEPNGFRQKGAFAMNCLRAEVHWKDERVFWIVPVRSDSRITRNLCSKDNENKRFGTKKALREEWVNFLQEPRLQRNTKLKRDALRVSSRVARSRIDSPQNSPRHSKPSPIYQDTTFSAAPEKTPRSGRQNLRQRRDRRGAAPASAGVQVPEIRPEVAWSTTGRDRRGRRR